MKYRIVPFWIGKEIIQDDYDFVCAFRIFGKDIFYIHKINKD